MARELLIYKIMNANNNKYKGDDMEKEITKACEKCAGKERSIK